MENSLDTRQGYVKWYDPSTTITYVTCRCSLDAVTEENGTVKSCAFPCRHARKDH